MVLMTPNVRQCKEGGTVFIHEAIQARTGQKPYITRKAWNKLYPTPGPGPAVWILPTDTQDGCIFECRIPTINIRSWKPTVMDLLANDWEPVSAVAKNRGR